MTDTRLRVLLTAEDRTAGTFGRLRTELRGLQSAAGGLGSALSAALVPLAGALSVGAIVGFTKRTIDGIDALNDLKDATGASISTLSALEDVALRTGSSMETASAALIKLNQALAAAEDPGSDAALAIKAIGLNVAELRALDPVEALQRVGKALLGFADNGAKGRIQLELLGKSTRELAPLLKDLGEAGALVGTVTDQQAEAAEKFNKQLASLNKNVTDLARTLAGPLVDSLNAAFDKINQAPNIADKLALLFGAPFSKETRDKQFALLGLGLQRQGPVSGIVENGPLDRPPANRPSLPDVLGKKTGTTSRARPDKAWNLDEWLLDVQRTVDRAFLEADSRAADQQRAMLERRQETAEQMLDELLNANARATVALVADERQRGQALIAIDTQVQLRKLAALEVYGEQYMAMRDQILQAEQLALRQLDADLAKSKETGKTVADDIGLVFASAAGKAITEWTSFRGLLQAIGQDLLQIAVKATITDPLSKLVSGGLGGGGGGFNLGSLLSSFAGLFAAGGTIPAGQWGIVGERGPEIVRGGSAGALVMPGTGGVTLVQHINIGAGVGRHEVMAAMQATRASAIAGVADAARRGRGVQ